MTDFAPQELSGPNKEQDRKIFKLKTIQEKTGWIFYHGTGQGMITRGSEPSPLEYAHRSPPPSDWKKKIRFCLKEHPPLSAGRIIPDDMEHSVIWAPAGLLLADGEIVGTGGHIAGPDGKLVKLGGEKSFPYSPHATPSELRGTGHAVYEVGVEKPEFSGIYFCPTRAETAGNGAYENLEEKTIALGKETKMPVFKIDENGQKELVFKP